MFQTRVTELLGIEYPVIQGGMLWLSRAEMAAAVSNAGGLGIISAATFPSRDELKAEIRKTKELTDRPFGVNIPFLPAIKPLDIPGFIDVMGEEGVEIAETAGRNPQEVLPRFKEHGIKVMHKVTAVRFARKVQEIGCDAVIVDGFECAGHPGEEDVSSLVLLPRAVDAVDIPIIAAGGFANGRGLVAALALGAEAVLMGTRFMVSREAPMHDRVKEYLTTLPETETTLVLRSLRNTARVIKNNIAAQVQEMEGRGAGIEELIPLVSGQREKDLMETGDMEKGLLHCGQVVGLIHDIPSVEEIIQGIMSEAKEVRERLCR